MTVFLLLLRFISAVTVTVAGAKNMSELRLNDDAKAPDDQQQRDYGTCKDATSPNNDADDFDRIRRQKDAEAYAEAKNHYLESYPAQISLWISISTSLTSLFGIGSILAATDSIRELELPWRISVAALLGLGIAFLARSFFVIKPDFPPDPSDISGAEVTWSKEKNDRAENSRRKLKLSLRFTIAGLLLVSTAMAMVWFAPREE